MLKAICSRDGTVHHADEAHRGKMLRCAKCGDAVQIGSSVQHLPLVTNESVDLRVPSKRLGSKLSVAFPTAFLVRNKMLVLLLSAAVIALVFIFAHSWNVREVGNANDDAANRVTRAIDPFAAIAVPIEELHRRLPNGTRILPDDDVSGQGVLTIDNRTGQDAAVKVLLSSGSAGAIARDVYITSDSKLDLRDITPGSYTVLFTLGDDWDDVSREFTRDTSYFRFGHDLDFSETENSESVLYSHEEITLHTLPSGTVPRVSISRADFERR